MATAESYLGDPRERDAALPPLQAQPVSDEDETAPPAVALSSAPLHDKTAAGDFALRSVIEEDAFQALSDGPWAKRPRLALCEDAAALEDNDFLSLTFPKKLWKIVESEQFKSLWWDDEGHCVVIDEELFKKEVLERKGPLRIFETDCMKSFIRQLNLYGFSKMRQNFQRSASLVEFLAEEKAAYAFSKVRPGFCKTHLTVGSTLLWIYQGVGSGRPFAKPAMVVPPSCIHPAEPTTVAFLPPRVQRADGSWKKGLW